MDDQQSNGIELSELMRMRYYLASAIASSPGKISIAPSKQKVKHGHFGFAIPANVAMQSWISARFRGGGIAIFTQSFVFSRKADTVQFSWQATSATPATPHLSPGITIPRAA